MQARPRWPWYARALALVVALGALSSYVALSGCNRSARRSPAFLPATKVAPMDIEPAQRTPPPLPPPGNATGNNVVFPATKSAPMHLLPPPQAPQPQAPQPQAPR